MLRRFSLAVVGVAAIGWIFYLGATWGPRSVDSTPRRAAEAADPLLVEESRRLEREFEAIASHREPTERELDLLRDAIARQREYNQAGRAMPEDRRRLESLEDRLGGFVARDLHAASLEAEAEGGRLVAAGEMTAGVEQLRRALELQRTIDRDYARSGFRDASRASRLQQQLASVEAEPLYQQSLVLEQQGKAASEAHQWSEARRFFTEALQLQSRINETSRRSAYYNPARIQQLNHELAQLRVGEMMSEVHDLERQAHAREQQGQWESAAQMYEQAMVIQNQINRDHPQSPFVSTERVVELDAARQTALSARLGTELESALTAMRQAIRRGEAAAAGTQIETARRLLGQISERFPRSRYADFQVRLELDYLALVQPSLPELQRSLREELLPIPGRPGWEMTRGPVAQRLYLRIMSGNPSRNRGDDLPVDSVTLAQAREFCRRASWILAGPVRLPERADFEAAVGEWDSARHAGLSWHRENSGGASHPVTSGEPNAHGFFHLVGNLRHWLDDGAENGALWTAGASFAEELPEADLFRKISQDQRDPTIGFRYLVKEQ